MAGLLVVVLYVYQLLNGIDSHRGLKAPKGGQDVTDKETRNRELTVSVGRYAQWLILFCPSVLVQGKQSRRCMCG